MKIKNLTSRSVTLLDKNHNTIIALKPEPFEKNKAGERLPHFYSENKYEKCGTCDINGHTLPTFKWSREIVAGMPEFKKDEAYLINHSQLLDPEYVQILKNHTVFILDVQTMVKNIDGSIKGYCGLAKLK